MQGDGGRAFELQVGGIGGQRDVVMQWPRRPGNWVVVSAAMPMALAGAAGAACATRFNEVRTAKLIRVRFMAKASRDANWWTGYGKGPRPDDASSMKRHARGLALAINGGNLGMKCVHPEFRPFNTIGWLCEHRRLSMALRPDAGRSESEKSMPFQLFVQRAGLAFVVAFPILLGVYLLRGRLGPVPHWMLACGGWSRPWFLAGPPCGVIAGDSIARCAMALRRWRPRRLPVGRVGPMPLMLRTSTASPSPIPTPTHPTPSSPHPILIPHPHPHSIPIPNPPIPIPIPISQDLSRVLASTCSGRLGPCEGRASAKAIPTWWQGYWTSRNRGLVPALKIPTFGGWTEPRRPADNAPLCQSTREFTMTSVWKLSWWVPIAPAKSPVPACVWSPTG